MKLLEWGDQCMVNHLLFLFLFTLGHVKGFFSAF